MAERRPKIAKAKKPKEKGPIPGDLFVPWTDVENVQYKDEEDEWVEEPEVLEEEADIISDYERKSTRVITQFNNFLIPNLMQALTAEHYVNVAPEYQRRVRWDQVKQSRLIESLLMNIPIPPVFLFEHELARYEVVDGQQRLTAIKGFFNNEYLLKGLEEWESLNGKLFKDLPAIIQRGLLRRSLAAVILLTESGKSGKEVYKLKRDIFERLNTGGVKLSAQEIRNCIYSGNFNRLLNRIARSDLFTKLWRIPPREPDEPKRISDRLRRNRLYSTMEDNEIVLRVFALSDPVNVRGGMKRTLDKYMFDHKDDSERDLKVLEKTYTKALENAFKVFGEDVFMLTGVDDRNSKPLYDAIMVALYRMLSGKTAEAQKEIQNKLEEKKRRLQNKRNAILKEPAKYELIVGRPNTKRATLERIEIFENIFNKVL